MTTSQSRYIASLDNVLATYNDKYVQRCLLGTTKEKNWNTIKFIYANIYRNLLYQYFNPATVDNNFWTGAQAETAMQHFCDITKTFYFLKQT
jgi:hypothetical protein